MYTVFIAGLIPTLRPFFKKDAAGLNNPNFNYHNRRNTRPIGDDDGFNLTSSPTLPSITEASSTTAGRDTASQTTSDVDLEMQNELTVKATETEWDVEAVGIAQ